MGKVLRILQLRIRTDHGWQDPPYDLDAQVVAIVGPADTGKTSFVDALTFGLGAEVPYWRGLVHKHLREVELEVRVATRTYTLRRARTSKSHVEVTDEVGDPQGRFPVRRQPGQRSLSDWLLGELGLGDLFAAAGSLDFPQSILPFLFLAQDTIDQYVIMPESRDADRVTTLKLLLGIIDPSDQEHVAMLRQLDNEIRGREKKARVIEKFLEATQATSAHAVRAELTAMTTRRTAAETRLAQLRQTANAGVADAENWQNRLREANAAVISAETQLGRAHKRHAELSDRLEEINKALQALKILEDADPAERVTLGLAFDKNCTSCEQPLTMVRAPGCCHQCGQPLRGYQHLATRIQLQEQHQHTTTELTIAEDAVTLAQRAADTAQNTMHHLLTANHRQTKDSVAPHLDAVAAAAAEVAGINQRITDLTEVAATLRRLDDERAEIDSLRATRAARAARDDNPGVGIYRPDAVVDELSKHFDETLADIGLPGYLGRAYIDPERLLPYVDGEPFRSRGGGGRTAVSLAYSLTLLQQSLRDELTALPCLLVIDSPKKGLGANKTDQEFARRVYQRFLDAMANRGLIGDGRYERPFQLIIVDNDKPKVRGVRIVHEFTRGDGFIKNSIAPAGIQGDLFEEQ